MHMLLDNEYNLNIGTQSLLLHRAFCRITLIITYFILKHLKSLQHVSILRSSPKS